MSYKYRIKLLHKILMVLFTVSAMFLIIRCQSSGDDSAIIDVPTGVSVTQANDQLTIS